MRIVLKVSGESLRNGDPIATEMLESLQKEIKMLMDADHEILLVLGGGTFWRGRNGLEISSSISDQMGMLGSIMNAMALGDYLEEHEVSSRVFCAYEIPGVVKIYNYYEISKALRNKHVVVLGGGLGIPNFSTDMVTIEKAIQYEADMIIMAKNVDGIYDKDPRLGDAKKYEEMTHAELLNIQMNSGIDKLGVMDLEAMAALCKHKIPLYLYNAKDPNGLRNFVNNQKTGTLVITK